MRLVQIVLLFSCIVEPFIWLCAFDRVLIRKYQNAFIYLAYIMGDWALALVRSYVTSKSSDLSVVFALLFICYTTAFVCIAYDDKLGKHVLITMMLYLLSLSSDFIIIGILMIFGSSIESIYADRLMCACVKLISEGIFLLSVFLCYRKTSKNKYNEYEEFAPVFFGVILYKLPSIVLFYKIYMLRNNEFILVLFVYGELVVACLAIYALVILNHKKRMEQNLRSRLHDIEVEFSTNQKLEQAVTEINHFRHDIKSHLMVLEALIDEENIESAKEYLHEVKEDAFCVSEVLPKMKNRNVSIVLGQKKHIAQEAGISFFPEIMVENFVIPDKDICSILCNLLDNAIEAAGRCEKGFVNIIITPDSETDGYFIQCQNNYQRIELWKGRYITTKEDKEKHGFGINIIKKIVNKYNGKCHFRNEPSLNLFSVEIYIPGGRKK